MKSHIISWAVTQYLEQSQKDQDEMPCSEIDKLMILERCKIHFDIGAVKCRWFDRLWLTNVGYNVRWCTVKLIAW